MGKNKSKPLSAEYLERAAFHYLARYASSAGNLRRVLKNKVRRRCSPGEDPPPEAAQWISQVVAKCLRIGLIDDQAYGSAKIRSLLRSGKSLRQIRAYLASKLVAGDLIDRLMAEEVGPDGAIELQAAMTYAKRRRFGPFARPRDEDEKATRKRREKALASFGRAGFPFPLSKLIVDCASKEELETLVAEVVD